MLNSKDMSNNSPIPKSDKSDSGSSKDFDFYGFTNPFFLLFYSIRSRVRKFSSSYGIELYNYYLQTQTWIMVGRVVGVVCLITQALFLSVFVRMGYLRKKDLSVDKE